MKNWLYFLTDEGGKSYHINNGLVQTTAAKKQLLYTPDGWQDIAIGWERNILRVGTVRNFSLPLGFVLDGAQILRDIMYTKSIEEKIYLLITKLDLVIDATTYKYLYNYFYKGELDLSTLRDDDTKMTVNIMEGGLSKLLKANEGTVYEFPMNAPETILVKMDGIALYLKHTWLLIESTVLNNVVPGLSFVNSDGQAAGTAAVTVDEGPLDAERYFFTTSIAITGINLKTTIIARNPMDADITLVIKNQAGVVVATLVSGTYSNTAFTSIPVDVTFNSNAGDKFFLQVTSPGFVEFKEATLSANFSSTYPTTYIKAYKPTDLYPKIIEKITGKATDAKSDLLATKDHLVYTSGDAIRGIPTAKLKTNLNNFFEDAKVRYAAGLGIESGKIAIETYEHFLDETNPIDLGNAKDLKVTLAADLMHNTVKVGYTEKNIDDVNGKYSFNNSHLYSSPLTKVVKELSLISPYTSDPYVIELTRINLEGKTTTDNSKDNEVFILNVKEVDNMFAANLNIFTLVSVPIIIVTGADAQYNSFQGGGKFTIAGSLYNNKTFTVIGKGALDGTGGGFTLIVMEPVIQESLLTQAANITITGYELNRPAYIMLTGVPDPDSIFNIEELTPKRILKVQEKWINSIFYHFPGEELKFQTTEKNADLYTVLGNDIFWENANFQIGNERLFLPFYFEFDTEVPIDLVSLLETNPNRCFSFNWNDKTFTGFLMKAGIAPNTNKEQAFKLLAAPSNNIQNLI